MYSSCYPIFNPFHQQTTPSSYLPPLASPASITSSSCSPSFQEEEEEEQPFSTVSTLCFDDGLSINFDGILMECNNSNDSMASSIFDAIMADYLWENCWHPAMDNSTPIAHDDEEIASSHHMWDHWLNAENQLHPLHFSSDDGGSPSMNGVSAGSSTPSCISMSLGNFPGAPASYESSTPSCTSMSPGDFPRAPASYDSSTPSCTSMLLGNFPGGLTGTPATYSSSFASSPAMDNLYLQSSPYSEASSFASPPQLDLGACSNAVENLTHEVEYNEEVVAIQVKCNTADDGYVWRKYGQKNIKGRRFPRSYYRCAQPGCPIRKQTESSSEMEGYMVMTYFGKHNHHQSN